MSQESAKAAVPQAVCVVGCPRLNAQNLFTASLTVLPTKHLFGHNGTMMTHVNSR